jgi:hypothetical protein
VIKFITGLLVISVIWLAGMHVWSPRVDLPATITHGDEVLDFGLREMK